MFRRSRERDHTTEGWIIWISAAALIMVARAFAVRHRAPILVLCAFASGPGALGEAAAQTPSRATASPQPFAPAASSLRGVRIARIEVKAGAGIDAAKMLQVANLRAGQALSATLIKGAIQRLFTAGGLSNVVVRARREGAGAVVTLELTPRARLAEIAFKQNRAIAGEDLRKDFSFIPDQEYSPDQLEALEKSLAESYKRRGYYRARFDLAVEEQRGADRVRILVTVDEGQPTRVRSITFHGDLRARPADLAKKVKIRPGDRFDRERVRTGMDSLADEYRRRGYYEVRVREPRVELVKGTNDAHVRFEIAAGPKIVVRFVDARGFSRTELLKRLQLGDERKIDGATLPILRERLERMLREMGFAAARVTPSLATRGGRSPRKRLTFRLQPGPRARVVELAFPGAKTIAIDRLREIVFSLVEERIAADGLFERVHPEQVGREFGVGSPHDGQTAEGHPSRPLPPRRVYIESAYRDAIEDIEKLYKSEGFTRVKVRPPTAVGIPGTPNLRVEIPIEEGPRAHVRRVSFFGNYLVNDEELESEAGLPLGSHYNSTAIEEARVRIQKRYERLGYIFVKVEDTQRFTGADGSDVEVTFQLTEGSRVYVGRVLLEGNVKTKDHIIYDVLTVSPGDVYNGIKIAESQQALFNLGLFSTANIEPVNRNPERFKNLRVSMRERKPGSVEAGVGFSFYDGPRGFLNLAYSNLFGRNYRALFYLKLNYQLFLYTDAATRNARQNELSFSELLERQITFSFQDPKIIGLPLPIGWRVDITHQRRSQVAFGLTKLGALATLEAKPATIFNMQLQYELDFSDLQTPGALVAFLRDIDQSPFLSLRDREQLKRTTLGTQVFTSIRPIFSLDLRDNAFNPRKGLLATFLAEYSSSITDGSVNYFKLQGTVTGHIPLGRRSQIALQGSAGGILHASQRSRTPAHRALFLGGRASIRGYPEESIIAEGRPITPSEADALYRSGLPPTSTGGEVFYFARAELRYPLTQKLEGALFYDLGNLWLNSNIVDFARVPRMSTGVGVRYPTPVGPLTFDIGFNLTRRFIRAEDPLSGELRDIPFEGFFQIHFSIGVF
jgi:outer membrane protein assembly complex protein YaeT